MLVCVYKIYNFTFGNVCLTIFLAILLYVKIKKVHYNYVINYIDLSLNLMNCLFNMLFLSLIKFVLDDKIFRAYKICVIKLGDPQNDLKLCDNSNNDMRSIIETFESTFKKVLYLS